MAKITRGQWLTVATNMAVLLGVILLAYELRQNANIARLEMIQTRISAHQQSEQAFLDPELSAIWVKSFSEPESMTLAEIRSMDAYMAIHMNQMMRVLRQEQQGLLEKDETLKLMEGDFWFLFGSPFGQAWWEVFGQDWPPELVELALPIVESVKHNELEERFLRLQRDLADE